MNQQIRVPHNDQIPALERATSVAINIYDQATQEGDTALRSKMLLLLVHIREARKAGQ